MILVQVYMCLILQKYTDNSPRRSHHQRITEIGTACLWLEEFQVLRRWNCNIRLICKIETVGRPNQRKCAQQQQQWFVGKRLLLWFAVGHSVIAVGLVFMLR